MRTEFTANQLADPAMASSESVIRKCVHCGFCTATCPTYTLLGDELDSPRGRIYLIKNMLETEAVPTAEVVKHVDRCLSCLSCVTTCPSGVNYMHLIDHARAYIEQNHRRPIADRAIRTMLATILPHPARLRIALRFARVATPFRGFLSRYQATRPIAAMLALAPTTLPDRAPATDARIPAPRGRVALLQGCVEPVLRPEFRHSAISLLNRAGFDVQFAPGETCCGALVHHLGREEAAFAAARRNVDAWWPQVEDGSLDAIIVTASGCGTTIRDYGFMLRDDPAYADKARRVSEKARDICEFLDGCDLPEGNGRGLTVAYHAACSLQHGQKVTEAPKALLVRAGYSVRTPAEAHLCCGSAGTYNILQPEIAGQLATRKVANIDRLEADVIATGNIGCTTQIGLKTSTPVVHTIQLLDWAMGGPAPHEMEMKQ